MTQHKFAINILEAKLADYRVKVEDVSIGLAINGYPFSNNPVSDMYDRIEQLEKAINVLKEDKK